MVCLLRSTLYVVTVLFFATFVGCGSSDGIRSVTGIVKYNDGSFPNSEMAVITFEPAGNDMNIKGASGDIGKDGTFELTTTEPGDGALPGDYIVTVRIMEGYPDPVFAVAQEYTDVEQTPLKATVESSGKNHFEFEITR